MRSLVFAALAIALGGGCKSSEMYSWGDYEEGLVEVMVSHEGGEAQAESLSRDLQRAEAAGRRAPPGAYAHLGYLLALGGDLSGARQAFAIEQRIFPESRRLMERMIARVEGRAYAPTQPKPATVVTSSTSEPGGLR